MLSSGVPDASGALGRLSSPITVAGQRGSRTRFPMLERRFPGSYTMAAMTDGATPSETLVLRGGRVYDGTGAPPFLADVVVRGERVVALLPPGSAPNGAGEFDATGWAVCPGFIDLHGHSDMALLHPEGPDLLSPFLQQGITTQVVGNCGLGVAPAPEEQRRQLRAFMALILPAGALFRWRTFGEYLRVLDAVSLPFNVATLVPHGALRCAVRGGEPGPVTAAQAEAMARLLDEGLRAGAFGLSAGLIYPPGLWADTDELVALCRLLRPYDALFACHVRGSSELALQAERELLEIAARAGVRVQHSHHEAFGPAYWHLARETLAMERRARRHGLPVASDVIPYHAVNTTLLAIFPPWALAGGVGALCERLADPELRRRIGDEIAERVPRWPPWRDGWAHNLIRAGGWDNVVLLQCGSEAHRAWLGRSLAQIAEREGRPPLECAAEVVRASGGEVMARYHAISGAPGDDGVLRSLLADPHHAIAVDVILKGDGVVHPGGFGAMPRLLGTYARERGWFSLAEAIRKATALAADRLGLPDRGRILPGCAADLVVFDPDTIAECGSWSAPDRAPRGIRAVFVNGRLAVFDGTVAASDAGRLLRPRRAHAVP